jgi:hypothetical protein
MAFGLQKAFVEESSLPPFTVFKDGTFGYQIRYRIISKDKNKFSPYSSIYAVKPNYVFERPAGKAIDDLVVFRQGPYVNIIWDAILIKDKITKNLIKKATQYDVWLSWSRGENNASWVLADRADGTLQGAIIPSSYSLETGTVVNQEPNTLSVEIFLRATQQSRNNTALLVYKRLNMNIATPIGPPSN